MRIKGLLLRRGGVIVRLLLLLLPIYSAIGCATLATDAACSAVGCRLGLRWTHGWIG